MNTNDIMFWMYAVLGMIVGIVCIFVVEETGFPFKSLTLFLVMITCFIMAGIENILSKLKELKHKG